MGKQPKSPESDGGSGEIKCAVETESSELSIEERSLDETNVPHTSKKEEEESRPKEITTSDVLPVETRSLEEIPKPSEPKEGVAMEGISERLVIPIEATRSSNVTLSDVVVIEEAKAETSSDTDANVKNPESKEAPANSGVNNAEQKGNTEEKKTKKEKGKSNYSSSSSSSSESD